MKLLLDQHFSFKLVDLLADVFPDSSQARLLRRDRESDTDLWYFARREGFTIVTKDEDIVDLAILRGAPPKVIWVRIGNSTTSAVEALLRRNVEAIEAFAINEDSVILELFE